ncbi:YobI family P-loop NTPase [Comamonas squillarum]|uniref:ATP-binding protein n=1 Tax=Comamonas squillarum TaxID=2977320 RepID=A0ABY5ZVU7_9BURK|nr:ATP-binding protein [Comamonas sp. PR12]UXC17454.1 ATP-binding protein [Comamonas sp. PR12]
MKKTLAILKKLLLKSLHNALSWLEAKDKFTGAHTKFLDLAPTDEADSAGVYSEAILFATSNSKVFNIALTGPYGSGKSSIIKSFLKNYRRSALHISLAAFIPESNSESGNVSRQEIERSILQQMLYGADANKLPLSRFKRIQSPSFWSIPKSLYITLGILSLWYILSQQTNIISGKFFIPLELSNWLNLGIFFFSMIFLWTALHHFYIASFGLSLKSVSLKDVEIRPAHDDQTSILNRHLDEILYFFQSTDYDLVIIEDLDRFNDSEIFVTLREINSLINENAGIKRTIRFLYALRDDMFINTDRTKFFEFIIPVIPIINSSNSIDMVLKQGRRLSLDERLDKQFLREVSRYLNDLRLINNIFNEYAIYVANLETDGENLLDANKLLAILIYKNVYPKDFEQLHRGIGNLASIFSRQQELIRQGEARYRKDIEKMEALLVLGERQTPSDLRELRQIYAMAIIEKLPTGIVHISLDRQTLIPLPQLADHSEFEKLIAAPRVYHHYYNNQGNWADFSNLQTEVDSQKSYIQRKDEIQNKDVDTRNKLQKKILELRLMIPTLRTIKLNKLLRLNAEHVEDLFKGFELNGELARFLILEGYLDDTYYQYTSLFHSGRLSPSDNKFLIQIRAFITPEPSFPLDNPKEVIAAMRDEDFRQSYVLNVRLVDSLLGDQYLKDTHAKQLLEFLSSNFDICEEFFSAYYISGLTAPVLLQELANVWKNLVPTLLVSPNNISHITQLIANLPLDSLSTLAREFQDLSDFTAENLSKILATQPELTSERLNCLDFDVKDFTEIKDYPKIVRFMFEEEKYELTIKNLEYIFQEILLQSDIKPLYASNFTTIRSTNSPPLINKVERNFSNYMHDILLKLTENSEEDVSAILEVLTKYSLDQSDLRSFLDMQSARLPSLEGISEKLHSMLFQLNAIEATWENCLSFIESTEFEPNSLIGFLDSYGVRTAILQHSIPSDAKSSKLRQFILNSVSLSDDAYKAYIQALPNQFTELPQELESSKTRILISNKKITFNKANLDVIDDNQDLQLIFVKNNIHAYLDEHEHFSLGDNFNEKLLQSDIDNSIKLKLVELMNLGASENPPERFALIGSIIHITDGNISSIDKKIAQLLIIHSSPVETQISLLNKYNSLLSDEDVRFILAALPRPYSDIKIGYNSPKLKKSSDNITLVKSLDSRNIISSWGEDKLFTDEIKINLYRR